MPLGKIIVLLLKKWIIYLGNYECGLKKKLDGIGKNYLRAVN
jgi:hypothetical protein